jgi:hypothetical protein
VVADIMWSINGYPYFAFIPDKPNFEGPLFKCLKISSATITLDRTAFGFQLSSSIAQKWCKLERRLLFITEKLLDRASSRNPKYSHDVRPFHKPSHFGYSAVSSTEKEARKAISLAKSAFVILMARCSFGITINCSEHEIAIDHPIWARYLVDQGVHCDWIKLLQELSVAKFQNYSRKGVIIHVGQCQWLHYVGQMISFGIKIWFYWGIFPHRPLQPLQPFVWVPSTPEERIILAMIEAKCSSSGSLPQLTPLQPPAKDSSLTSDVPEVEQHSGQKPGESWMAFFKRWAEENVTKASRETLADRECREAREKAHANHDPPGKRGAIVYEWEEVDGFWIRKRVDRFDVEDTWYSFTKAQRRYDSFRNEWDLHSEFSPRVTWYQSLSLSSDEEDELPALNVTAESNSAASPPLNLARYHSQPELHPASSAIHTSNPSALSSDLQESSDARCINLPAPVTNMQKMDHPLSSSSFSPFCQPVSAAVSTYVPAISSGSCAAPAPAAVTPALNLSGVPGSDAAGNTDTSSHLSPMNHAGCHSPPPTLDEPPVKHICRSSTTSPRHFPDRPLIQSYLYPPMTRRISINIPRPFLTSLISRPSQVVPART